MAVVVTAYDVVVRVDALADRMSAFARTVPNATFCTDHVLARASFMNAADREQYRRRSARCHRVRRQKDRFRRRTLARTRHLEYLGAENGVEAYRDERTGQKLYTGRTQPTLSPEQVARVAKLRDEANALLSPLLSKVIARKALGFFEKRTVKKAAALFHSVLEVVPEEWATRWTLGMIARAETEHSVALEHFRRAYRANPTQRDVGREYAGQCFINGEAAEGVQMSRELHARFPNDVGLHSNLALALLIGGDLDEAVATAHAAQARDPSDPVTKNLVDYTAKVKMGHIARPTKMPGG